VLSLSEVVTVSAPVAISAKETEGALTIKSTPINVKYWVTLLFSCFLKEFVKARFLTIQKDERISASYQIQVRMQKITCARRDACGV
jgi:hypothetical protein